MDTSHTAAITSLHVQSQSLWSTSEYIMNCYESAGDKIADRYHYICDDKINDFLVAEIAGPGSKNPVLAC